MSQAIADPQELRRFAGQLKAFTMELSMQMGSLKTQLQALGQTWRDQENLKFQEEFDQTMVVLTRFVQAAEEQVPFLMRKAERIEDYLHQR